MTAAGKRASVLWSRRARKDLCDIGDFIARDKPEAAARWVARVLDAADRVAVFPASGWVVPEIGRDDVREVILSAYRIVNRIRENDIIVLTVFEGHRRLPNMMDDDGDAG